MYRVEFTSPPGFIDDVTPELHPFLVAARKGEVLFGNPFTDFSRPVEEERDNIETGGVLDDMRGLRGRSDEYQAALEDVGRITQRLGNRQGLLNAKVASPQDGVDPLDHALAVVDEMAALWDETSDDLERLLDETVAPLTIVMERGARATYRLSQFGDPNDEDAAAAVSSLKRLGTVAGTSASQQMSLARTIREQSAIAAALRRPGARLASILERYASGFERIATLADVDTQ